MWPLHQFVEYEGLERDDDEAFQRQAAGEKVDGVFRDILGNETVSSWWLACRYSCDASVEVKFRPRQSVKGYIQCSQKERPAGSWLYLRRPNVSSSTLWSAMPLTFYRELAIYDYAEMKARMQPMRSELLRWVMDPCRVGSLEALGLVV